EGKIFEKIQEVSDNPKLIEKYILDFNKKQLREKFKLDRLSGKLKKEIAEIQRKRKKIVNWLTKTLPDKITTKTINSELDNLDKKLRKLEEDLLIIEARIQNLQKKKFTSEIICGYLKKFAYLYDSFNSAQRKLLVESLVKKVSVDSKDKIDLKLSLPLAPLTSYIKKVQSGISSGVVHQIKPINEIIVNFTLNLNSISNRIYKKQEKFSN
ncbi:MAG: hypothetical protein ACTSRG_26295, partial [Candidatus Helarchaeota archaeon]